MANSEELTGEAKVGFGHWVVDKAKGRAYLTPGKKIDIRITVGLGMEIPFEGLPLIFRQALILQYFREVGLKWDYETSVEDLKLYKFSYDITEEMQAEIIDHGNKMLNEGYKNYGK